MPCAEAFSIDLLYQGLSILCSISSSKIQNQLKLKIMGTIGLGKNVIWSILLIGILLFMGGCSETLLEDANENYLKSAPQSSEGAVYHVWDGDIDACEQGRFCLVAGQYMDVGNLDGAYDNDGNIYLTYNTAAGWYLKEIHLFVGHEPDEIPTNKNNHPRIGHFPYQVIFNAYDMVSHHTVMIENPHMGTPYQYGCENLVIAAHAVVVNEAGDEETAWGTICDPSETGFVSERFVEQGTWATYIAGELCMQPCEVDYSYAWEDLKDEGNDRDYNDFVVQAIVWKQMEESLKTYMKFIAKARGAGYDHKLYVALDDGSGGYFKVTVFESTKETLLYSLGGWTYNTGDPCNPLPFAEATIILDGDYTDPLSFMPVLTVYPSGTHLDPTGSYDLNIWELAVQMGSPFGTIYTVDDLSYPNGLVIPNDWKWPLEQIAINLAYGDFMDVDHWVADWYLNLSDASLVWDPANAVCN
jgi:hypothetical protein